MIRLGLCCMFRDEPIKFRNTTATAIAKLKRPDALAKLSMLCAANAEALLAALRFCAAHGIGCFRVNSQILPLKTHSLVGYAIEALPQGSEIVERFRQCGGYAREHGLRISFHPDQFVVLNSRRPEVVEASLRELEYQAEVAEWIGADVVNIHGGGAFGDKQLALADFARNLARLSPRARSRLTVENDDKHFYAQRSTAALPADGHAAGVRCASSSLQPGRPVGRSCQRTGPRHLDPRTAVPYLQPNRRLERPQAGTPSRTTSTRKIFRHAGGK